MATGIVSIGSYTYTGPGTSYAIDGFPQLTIGTSVTILWSEGTWLYIEVNSPYRRTYLPYGCVTNIVGTVPTKSFTFVTRYVNFPFTGKFGPSESYQSAAYIPQGYQVQYCANIIENSYMLVQHETPSGIKRRFWFKASYLSATYSGPSTYMLSRGFYNNIYLSIIRISPDYITLGTLGRINSMNSSSYYGINGGWFDGPDYPVKTLNIAMQDGVSVCYDGTVNAVGKGVVYWTGSLLKNTTSQYASQISGISATGTWAQGGISLSLGNSNWKTVFTNEYPMDTESASTGRSAMIADVTSSLVYLIVTNTTGNTVTMFRTGIQSFLGISDGNSNNTRFKGILLDGGGSSQLKAKDMFNSTVSLTGDGRFLTQIITIS